MAMWLRQSTASQEIVLGRFVDSTDGNTEETALTIANTDIKIWVEGATTFANKNSGGATHIANGNYSAVLDATDTATLGKMEIHVHVSGALSVKREFMVVPAMIYDSIILGSDRLDTNTTHVNDVAASSVTTINANIGTTQPINFTGTGASALVKGDMVDVAGAAVSTSSAQIGVNVVNAGGTAWASGSLTSGVFASGAITAAAIAADAIGASELASDAVTEIRSLASGTSDSGTTTTMVDAARTEADTDYWVGSLIVFTSGTIAGQARYITGFTPGTDTITFAPATTQAVSTQTYEIWPTADFLRPTTSGRTLDVTATGGAGIDWGNVENQSTSVNLSATTTNLVNTVTTYTGNTPQTGDSYAIVNSGTHGNAAIKGYVDDIGVAGAGLTDLGGFSTTAKGQIQAEAEDAIVVHRLDELLNADSDVDGAAPPTVGSVFHELMSKTAGSFTFDQTTDSNEALRDRGDAAWITATGFSTLDAAGVRTAVGLASANLDTQLAAIFADTDSLDTTKITTARAAVLTDLIDGGRLDLLIDAILARLPTKLTKNTAFSAFMFKMVDSTDHVTAETGLTITATRSIDGAAFASCTNSATEVSGGWYKIDLAAADVNGNMIVLRFAATGADTREVAIVTQP